MKQKKRKQHSAYSWLLVIVLSLCFHFGVLYELKKKSVDLIDNKSLPDDYIKLKIDDSTEVSKKEEQDLDQKRILEAPLPKTERPEQADFLGQNDHKAKKLMKVKKLDHDKAKDPGLKNKNALMQKSISPKKTKKGTETEKKEGERKTLTGLLPGDASKKMGEKASPGTREGYENLLAEEVQNIAQQETTQGYMDHLDDIAEEGETIDMNTREYRFIGYFTGLRKAIELVWVYPMEAARRGIHGHVIVKFIILASGKISKVQVMESSGYKVLDNAIVEAIQIAAPYAPLPNGFKKDRLVIRGAFSYLLE